MKTILTLLLILSFSSLSATEDKRKLPESITIIGVEKSSPFSFTLPDGSTTGLYIEYWRLWSKSNNIPIKIVMQPFDVAMDTIKNKGAVIQGVFINDERKQWADFSNPIHNLESGIIFNKKHSKNIIFSELSELSGAKVAVQAASYQARYITKKYPSIKLVSYKNTSDGLQQLLNNEVDAIVGEIPNLKTELTILRLDGVYSVSNEVLLNNTVHAALAKGQLDLLRTINEGINNIPIQSLIDLEKNWLPTIKPYYLSPAILADLTLAEQQWLKEHLTLTYGVVSSYPNRPLGGLIADYTSYLRTALNIHLQPIFYPDWDELMRDHKKGGVDLIIDIVDTPLRAKEMIFTQPYFVEQNVIISRKDGYVASSINELANKNVGADLGYLTEILNDKYPGINVTSFKSYKEGIAQLTSGNLDAYIMSLSIANSVIGEQYFNELVISSFIPVDLKLSVSVRSDLEPLIGIINHVFDRMPDKQRNLINNTWAKAYLNIGINEKVILKWTVIAVVIILLIIISIIIRANYLLKKEVLLRLESDKARQLLQGQLLQSQKMEALGKLAGGIAHDFNNILGIIMGYSSLIVQTATTDKLSEFGKNIYDAGERGARITTRIQSITKEHSIEEEIVNFNEVLTGQKEILQRILTASNQLIYELGEDLWTVKIDKHDLEDAMLNLCINAMHAMSETKTNARIIFRTENLLLKSTESISLNIPEGDYVLLSIADNGCGMESDVKEKIFEPFYSTKGANGSGLGLSQVFGFVTRSKGAISVTSELNHGSQFNIYFPRIINNTPPLADILREDINLNGDESILIVDDEVKLQNLAEEILTKHGYKTYSADSAKQALQILEENDIDCLLSDVIMPEMNGHELSVIAKELYPEIKVQLVSGYYGDTILEKSDTLTRNDIIHKPYNSNDLLIKIRRLMDN